ncbi:serine/threonine-protein kinase haspin homolog [Lepeophtheirus salmonis]|uniref:serine/threonine-protein kinase haspin homolog n=1 Tax=Lepeophtheirus salmonis TaxID=72036 RepID=UPI001AE83035|nr:serine/threonine-protein kinase haspin homolog [Lepeophtheirus salmonis]
MESLIVSLIKSWRGQLCLIVKRRMKIHLQSSVQMMDLSLLLLLHPHLLISTINQAKKLLCLQTSWISFRSLVVDEKSVHKGGKNHSSPPTTPSMERKIPSITSTPNTFSKGPIVLLQPLSDSILEKCYSQPVRCQCSSFDEDNILECDYCPVRIHASCHGIDQDVFTEIVEVGLLWNCPDCEEKKNESLDHDVVSSSPVAPPKLSFSKDGNPMIPAKGGKKWRRTIASNLLKRPSHPTSPLSTPMTISKDESIKQLSSTTDMSHEEDEIMHKLNELSLTDQNDASLDECIPEKLESLSPLANILSCCEQLEVLPFESIYSTEMFEKSKKVGEGTFGEVYLLNALESDSEYPPVLKLIPVDGSQLVNNEPQTTMLEVLTEIKVSLYLSNLGRLEKTPNFVSINKCHIVSGHYPKVLLRLWDDYDTLKESLNVRPDYFECDQKYIAFEFSNGGVDLETTTLYNANQGISVFNQVAHALAVAEEQLGFEHRDLHWGNILIQGTSQDILTYSLDPNNTYCVQSSGIKATIIDFSLSRLTCQVKQDEPIFKDISKDEALFSAVGDYQFEIYRLMRESNQNDWKSFTPYTNILWLHYLLDKLTSSVPYKAVKSRIHRSSMSTLRAYKKKILSYKSAKHLVLSDGVPFDD